MKKVLLFVPFSYLLCTVGRNTVKCSVVCSAVLCAVQCSVRCRVQRSVGCNAVQCVVQFSDVGTGSAVKSVRKPLQLAILSSFN